MKTPKEILQPYIETILRHTKIVDMDNAIKAMKEYAGLQLKYSIIDLESERMAWSLETFPESTALSTLLHARKELKEIEENISSDEIDATEYADAIMLLFDSAWRAGIPATKVLQAYAEKIKVNKGRTWEKNPDNSYSHIKDQKESIRKSDGQSVVQNPQEKEVPTCLVKKCTDPIYEHGYCFRHYVISED